MASKFKFTAYVPKTDERRTYGLVNVYDRETGELIGMLNPIAETGYVLRNTDGERLSLHYSGFDDIVYGLSRETSAAILKQRMRRIEEIKAARADSLTADCPNNWHNGSPYKQTTPCPECPSQQIPKAIADLIDNLRVALDTYGERNPDPEGGCLDQLTVAGRALTDAIIQTDK